MYKKLISFLLIFSVSISMLLSASFSASATSGASVNILDFVSLSDGTNTFSFKGNSNVSYSLNATLGSIRTYYVDIVFVATGIAVSSIVINRDGTNDFTGTVTQLGTSLYRVTCNMEGLVTGSFRLKFNNNGSNYSYITLLSFVVHTIPSNRVNMAAILPLVTERNCLDAIFIIIGILKVFFMCPVTDLNDNPIRIDPLCPFAMLPQDHGVVVVKELFRILVISYEFLHCQILGAACWQYRVLTCHKSEQKSDC